MGLTTRELLFTALEAAESRKAIDTVILDLRGISSVTDYFFLCSGSSDTNVRAIADAVIEKMKEGGQRALGVEGYREGTWVLMDYVDVVFHVFHQEKRLAFALEDLWRDAKKVSLDPAAPVVSEGP